MPVIYKHGKNCSYPAVCPNPNCQCMFEYTSKEVNSDGYVECPDCGTLFKHLSRFATEDFQYTRDKEAEAVQIEECLNSICFNELSRKRAAIAKEFKADEENYDIYLYKNTSEELRQIAENELKNCFDHMETHGYFVHYRNGDVALSYVIEGVFNVNTYYDFSLKEYWCTCDFVVESGCSC